jgi:hypothetical protein
MIEKHVLLKWKSGLQILQDSGKNSCKTDFSPWAYHKKPKFNVKIFL